MMETMKAPAAALAALLLAAAPAAAAEARASGNAPVRLHPHPSAPVIDRLQDGVYYELEDCTRQARWCLVSDRGYELGWVRGSQLVGAAAKIPVTPFEFLVTPDFRDRD
ncbi:MAG TPA: SH3 domain-containing protein [Devosiaceae bacterium]|jgi:uncharacterized protein YraI|nr:SH3 domain-containing protein [Devosiaceae bacterium]